MVEAACADDGAEYIEVEEDFATASFKKKLLSFLLQKLECPSPLVKPAFDVAVDLQEFMNGMEMEGGAVLVQYDVLRNFFTMVESVERYLAAKGRVEKAGWEVVVMAEQTEFFIRVQSSNMYSHVLPSGGQELVEKCKKMARNSLNKMLMVMGVPVIKGRDGGKCMVVISNTKHREALKKMAAMHPRLAEFVETMQNMELKK